MEFNVLGPLKVVQSGESVHVSSAYKPRLLLSILLTQAGRPLSADALITGIWGDDAPLSARRNLHQYIHRIRGAVGSERLLARAGGYAIITEPDALDAARFLRLAQEGAEALDNRDHAIAAKLLREALDLWQGKAYAEFLDCELVATEATRLEQARLAAYEHWSEAELALNRPDKLVPVLTGLVRTHPFEENLVGLLMRALAQNGRQAEALQVFRTTRAALREQLGIEPAAGLQAIHLAVLRGEDFVAMR